MTLLVNLYGGPGTGKSTTAALLFGALKTQGVNAELVTEYAKELVWEKRHAALSNQLYILGKQAHRLERLRDQVDVIVTDSPILFSLVYSRLPWDHPLSQTAIYVHSSWDTLDIFLKRNPEAHPFNPKGRNQTEEEAMVLDQKILDVLKHFTTDSLLCEMSALTDRTTIRLAEIVQKRLLPS